MPDMPSRRRTGTSTGDFGFTNKKVYDRVPKTEIYKNVQYTLFYIPIPTVCSKVDTFLSKSMPDMPSRQGPGTSSGDFEFAKENVFGGVPKSERDKKCSKYIVLYPYAICMGK
jgi:hypothetical protein